MQNSSEPVQYYNLPSADGDARQIAFRYTDGADGAGPCLVFLPGYMSDMDGGKASAIFADAQARGQACLLLDYSGCGQSDGDFADGTLSRWRDEVCALIKAKTTGPIIVIGSSMGGWLMILVAETLQDRLAGMIGIAAAPDFTEWGYSPTQKAQMERGETLLEDNPYGPEPTPTYAGFYTDAQRDHLRLNTKIDINAPVRLIHGQRDDDVPWEISLKLAAALRSDDVKVTFVKDADHRLSRGQDIALLLQTVVNLSQTVSKGV